MNLDNIDSRDPLFPQLDQLADEYHRLSYFILKYIEDINSEEAVTDRLVQAFLQLNMEILEPNANVPDMVRSYCEFHCTRFPEKLARLPGLKEPLVNEYKKHLNEDDPTVSPTVGNALLRLGFVRDTPINEGLSLLLTKLDSTFNQIINLEIEPTLEVKRVALLNFLTDFFNLSEIRTLCFSLGISYEDISGETRTDKARELVAYCERHDRVEGLENKLRELRQPHKDELDKELLLPPTELLASIAKQTIGYVLESFVLLLSFYGRWISQWDHKLASNILELLAQLADAKLVDREYDAHDFMRMYSFIDSMNLLAQNKPSDVGEALKLTFQRNEFVSLKQVLSIIKHIYAYENRYLDVHSTRDINEETKRIVLKAKEFITYLKTGIVLEDENPDKHASMVNKTPIVPEIVRVQRRITMGDGSTRLDCIHEDGKFRTHRFNKLVHFYYQEESFFYVPTGSETANLLETEVIILPAKIEYPLESKL
jgi:hypothetical protein